ncbi:MAG TPA: N(G),N(G)-dimethylarginine dimethylaminohydrolase [Acidimicrobiales bacterium]
MAPRRALVRRPGPRLDEGIVTNIARVPVDDRLAVEQWDRYLAAFASSGWDLLEVPPADDCPDAVFVEDAMVVFRNVAVITRPGAESRRPETVEIDKVAESLGLSLNRIVAPGTLDGGDVLKVGNTIYVGRGGRTNAEGVKQLRAILTPLGATVVAVPVRKVLHLKSAVTALPDGSVVGFPPLVDDPAFFPHFVPVPEESGAHVVDLGGGRVLMAADCPESARLVGSLGYDVVAVDISEYQKLEGCVTCLSVRIRAMHGSGGFR